MNKSNEHGCAVCGTEIAGSEPHLAIAHVGRIHSRCNSMLEQAQSSGRRSRASAMSSQEPEAAALAFQWSADYHPVDLAIQRQECCPQGPTQTDLQRYYHQKNLRDYEPAPPVESFLKSDIDCTQGSCAVHVGPPLHPETAIMKAQASSWTGWHAMQRPRSFGPTYGISTPFPASASFVPSEPAPVGSTPTMSSAPVMASAPAAPYDPSGPLMVSAGPLSALSAHAADVLLTLGAPQAAAMHAQGEGTTTSGPWSLADWYTHIREEETKLFPILLHVADALPDPVEANRLRDMVMKLVADHTAVRNDYLDKGTLPPAEVAAPHGHQEDELIARYSDRILPILNMPEVAATGRATRVSGGSWGFPFDTITSCQTSSGCGTNLGSSSVMDSDLGSEDFTTVRGFPIAGGYPEVPAGEKFLDPWWQCVRTLDTQPDTGGGMEAGVRNWETGPAYLYGGYAVAGASRNGADRVAAMRSKIDRLRSSPIGPGVGAMVKQSNNSMEAIATDLYKSYRTAEGRENLAKRIGVPIDQINSTKDQVLSIINDPKFAAVRDQLAPLFEKLTGVIRAEIMKGVSEAASAIAGVSAAAGFVAAIPMIGAFVTMFIDMYGEQEKRKDEEAARGCIGTAQKVKENAEALAHKSYPIPWHPESLGYSPALTCGTDRDENAATARVFAAVAKQMREWLWAFDGNEWGQPSLLISLKADLQKWWALAVTLASSDEIYPVFHAMGNDPWGGNLATDEQVMLIAAPIAVTNGWDVDTFAAKLWEFSSGWGKIRDLVPGYLRKSQMRQIWSTGGRDKDTSTWRPVCGPFVRNAFYANMAVLAQDAFELAEQIKASGGVLIPDILESDRRAAAVTDEWIESECTGGVWYPMGGEAVCRPMFENARTEARAKIARIEAMTPKAPKPGVYMMTYKPTPKPLVIATVEEIPTSKSAAPLLWGGLAAGVAALASAPLWLIATPAALGLYFWFRKPKPTITVDRAPPPTPAWIAPPTPTWIAAAPTHPEDLMVTTGPVPGALLFGDSDASLLYRR